MADGEETTVLMALESPSLNAKHPFAMVRENAYIMLLMAFNLVMMDNNNILMMFLLVETREGCDFHDANGAYVMSQTVILLAVFVFRPFTAYLTDRLPNHNHILLLVAAWCELAGLVAMALLIACTPNGYLNPWTLIGLSVFKQCAEVQINNSIYKIFKMRLTKTGLHSQYHAQCQIIATIGITSEAIELLINLAVCGTTYAFIVRGASFETIKYFYLGVTILGNVGCLIVGAMVAGDRSYYITPSPSHTRRTIPINATSGDEAVREREPLISAVTKPAPIDTTARREDHHAEPPQPASPTMSCHYVVCAIKSIAGTPVAVGAIVHMTVVYTAQELMYDAQSLAVPGAHINASATACQDNFCAGYLTNTVYQDVFENSLYFVATLFFVAVLRRTEPILFYGRLFPVCMAILLGISVFLSRPETGQTVLALSMTAVVAFTYFFVLYSRYLSTAAIDTQWYGFYSFLIGTMQSVVDLAIYGAMEANVSNSTLLYAMYAFMAVTILVSLGFTWLCNGALSKAARECQSPK